MTADQRSFSLLISCFFQFQTSLQQFPILVFRFRATNKQLITIIKVLTMCGSFELANSAISRVNFLIPGPWLILLMSTLFFVGLFSWSFRDFLRSDDLLPELLNVSGESVPMFLVLQVNIIIILLNLNKI